ncbi:LysM peptidoglycan-binding domain-containing M23 family metallopeptidase [Streptomyces sp. WAC04114]|uniref:M23 family metallopeptidase n=1 Tax=Streptomyces sp. WAC04114 TaxID=2867961 RepID=UPI001C8B3C33|nr:LysM peptidoglycan-binding domain-containing M23 family metallopeptidase [Streptomyces sp. WAC04114]MBX9360939.1 LysM peptidoglycan-binding domain-containing M23 family metallopeptidase [Streptomyces sp. WAC04114]
MPAKGKHRRPKTQRFTRSIAVAGTGGAALALPLMGAAGAHAATPQSAPEKAVQSAPAAEKKAAEKANGARTYTVTAGDYLAKIADDQHVSGGWKKLYSDNRDAVGSDPSLIHPGLTLSIGKKAASAPKSSAPAAPKASAQKPSAAESAPKKETAAKPAAAKPAAASNSSGYALPVDGATVGTPYRMSGSMWSSGYHTGVDFVVPTGTSLKAVGAGEVVSAGWGGAYGNQVVIKLKDGHYAQYAHLSQLSVSAGQTVTAGQQVGLSGATGNVTGPHLHFEIRTTPDYGSDVDPVAFLRSHGVSVG